MKKLFIITWTLLGALLFAQSAVVTQAQEVEAQQEQESDQQVRIEVFEREECVHCQAEKAFLNDLLEERSDITVIFRDINIQEHNEVWQQLAEVQNIPKVTPITIIGSTVIQGFDKPETTGQRFLAIIERSKGKTQLTADEIIKAGGTAEIESVEDATCDDGTGCVIDGEYEPWFISIPFAGSVDVKQYSLPVLSILLGFIDGFNPCAMWVLVTFLIVLAQVGDRRKMWQIAGLFILAEAIMYYLILNVWFTAWDFVGLDNIITPLVGVIAIGGGIFFLYEYKTSDGTCKVTNMKQRAKISARIKEFVAKPMNLAVAGGIIALALSVNVIEFACSIGIPQAFTKIVELNNLGFWQTQWYMFLYILFYMVDDFIVFAIALYSFEKIGATSKYSRWSNLIGGILMILLGLLLIFKREWLLF